jgi:hypothetical protein
MSLTQSRLIYIITCFIVIIILAIWSANLLTEWGVDFGVYYAGSHFLDEKYRIYNEFFTHKGPLYFLFLKVIGYFIGWGHWQAYLSLLLTMLVFYIPINFILIKERVKPLIFLTGSLISLCLLYGQDTNSSIAFFQSGFLVISFWLLVRSKKFSYLCTSFFFLICAILSRVDAFIFMPAYLVVLIYNNHANNFKEYFKIFLILTLITIIPFIILMYLLDFNINQYLVHNFEFNNWYKNILIGENSIIYTIAKYFIRPTAFAIFTGSLFIIPFFLLFNKIISSFEELFNSLKNFFKKFKIHNSLSSNGYIIIILIHSFMGWFITNSDRNFHLMIVTVPLLFFYLMNIYSFNIKKNLIAILLSGYCLLIILYTPIYNVYKDKECLFSIYCESSIINQYADTIRTLKDIQDNEITIIGGGGWIYLYSNIKPKNAINDIWFYDYKKSFPTIELLNQHNNLLNMPRGKIFLINNSYLENSNKYLKEILSKSTLVKSQSLFSIFQIN